MPDRELLQELRNDLDGDPESIATEGLNRFSTPARGVGGNLDLVVRPADLTQVRTVVSWAHRHRIRLLPQGANTGLVGASTPGPSGTVVVLSTERLSAEVDIDIVNRTVVVDAGVRLSALNQALEAHGLQLPIDVSSDPAIGGMVATNTGGSRMLRYGDMRRHVLGVQAVIADGEASVVDEIRSLRKDNSGLNLTGLMIGSSGTLGVITKAALEVVPIPFERACAWIQLPDEPSATTCVLSLEADWGHRLSAFEVVSNVAMKAAVDNIANLRVPFTSGSLQLSALIEFERTSPNDGALSVDEDLALALQQMSEKGLLADAVLVPTVDAWSLRHSISEGLRMTATVIGFDLSVPRPRLAEFTVDARSRITTLLPRTSVADFGHWGDGGVHCNVLAPFDEPLSHDELQLLREEVYRMVVDEYAGSFSAEHGIGPINAPWWSSTHTSGAQILSHSVKAACDPLGIMGHPDMPY